MKKLLLLSVIALFSFNAFAQDETSEVKLWNHGGNVGLNVAQSHFNNWSAGGQDNINFVGLGKYTLNYKKDNSKWDNTFDLALGYNYFDIDKKPIKTDDKIDISSLYGYNIVADRFYLTADFNFKTQFVDGFDYAKDSTNRISGFFIPAYITMGLGVQYTPTSYFSLTLSPVSGRLTVVNDQTLANEGRYGVKKAEYDEAGNITKKGEKTRWELGAQMVAKFDYEIFKNITFSSKLVAYYDYMRTNEYNAFGEDFQCRVDWYWDNALILKVNDWLNCNVTANLVYDEDVLPIKAEEKVGVNGKYWTNKGFFQFKQVLALGFTAQLP